MTTRSDVLAGTPAYRVRTLDLRSVVDEEA